MFKAIVFDIGRTLIGYNKPLNWSALYRPAIEYVAKECAYDLKESDYQHAIEVLTKYNTRVNPREYEVTSTQIFTELIENSTIPACDYLAEKMKVDISEIIFVGDEEKDMICANNAGAYSVLINRDTVKKEFGQKREIQSLTELFRILSN